MTEAALLSDDGAIADGNAEGGYLVLARKWRPRSFEGLVGQDIAVRALRHALQSGRIHHAYLLTGTRGVGKTTLARIIAKALNCERGPTPDPCGQCAACKGIDVGRYPDYIEMDAASNRKVEEMAAVLETANYAPSAGRYRVFVIDEVHMLTHHAFNAMLKTLEEPPRHVVFVLATTDPQKVPVTVLSRCLQFALRSISAPQVAEQLARVLEGEQIPFDAAALGLIGRACAGSLRDALSLLDQAIAVGAGEVRVVVVREMLGVLDEDTVLRLLAKLASGDEANELVDMADAMAAQNAPFAALMLDMARMLQRIAVLQVRQHRQPGRGWQAEQIPMGAQTAAALAQTIDPVDVQVWYQILLHAVRDLPLAPDAHTGFTMTLCRLLAFTTDADTRAQPRHSTDPRLANGHFAAALAEPVRATLAARVGEQQVVATDQPVAATPPPTAADAKGFDGDWTGLAARIAAGGIDGQFLQQSELLGWDDWRFRVRVPIKPLAEPGLVDRVAALLGRYFDHPVQLVVEIGATGANTAAAAAGRAQQVRQTEAREAIERDPFVRELLDDFGATIVPDSIKPVEGKAR